MSDIIRAAIQQALDAYGDGWSCANWVVAVGLERITDEGEVETSSWWLAQKGQPDYVTDGLLLAVEGMRTEVDTE